MLTCQCGNTPSPMRALSFCLTTDASMRSLPRAVQLAKRMYEQDASPAEQPGCPPALTSVLVSIRPPPLPDAFASILPEVTAVGHVQTASV